MVAGRINSYHETGYLDRAEKPARQVFLPSVRDLIVSYKTRLITEARCSLKMAHSVTAIMSSSSAPLPPYFSFFNSIFSNYIVQKLDLFLYSLKN